MIHASITELKQGGHSLYGIHGEAAPEMVRVYQRIGNFNELKYKAKENLGHLAN